MPTKRHWERFSENLFGITPLQPLATHILN